MRSAPPPNIVLYLALAATAVGLLTAPLEARLVVGVAGLISAIVVTVIYGTWWRARHRRP